MDHWLPVVETRVKPTTLNAYRTCVTHHIVPNLGGIQLGRLTSQQINGLYQQLLVGGHVRTRGGLSPASVLNVHVVIRKALGDAVDAGLIARNVAERAKPPRPQTRSEELRYWTPAELRHFLELIEGHRLGAALHLLAMTGARRGEIAGLRWVDVDLDGARITIRQALLDRRWRGVRVQSQVVPGTDCGPRSRDRGPTRGAPGSAAPGEGGLRR